MSNKNVIYMMILLIIMSLNVSSQEIHWKSLPEAMNKNIEDKKLIFIDFYTDWCGWCKRMDQTTFQDKEVIQMLNKHFLSAKFNAEGTDTVYYDNLQFVNQRPQLRRSTHQFTFGVLGERPGYPSFAFMDKDNQLIGVIRGYHSAENLIVVLEYFSSESYLRETFDDFSKKRNSK